MFTDVEDMDRLYRGHNPAFVRRVWERRRAEEHARRLREEARRQEDERNRIRMELEAAKRREAELEAQMEAEQMRLRQIAEQSLNGDDDTQSAKDIIANIAIKHGLRYSDLIRQTRLDAIVKARHEAMVEVACRKQEYSLPMIGRLFKRDHTTVLHALRKAGLPDRGQGRHPGRSPASHD